MNYGEIVPVTGALVGPDGNPLAGQAVELQVNSDNAWRTARRVTTGADGSFLGDLKPSKRMYVRVRYPGSADVRGSASPRLLLNLRPVLELQPSATPRRARAARGRWQARWAPRKRVVTVVFQQRVRGHWRKVGTRAARARAGASRPRSCRRSGRRTGTTRWFGPIWTRIAGRRVIRSLRVR